MMDYLLRDGYFTGAEHAKIDHNRITNSFEIYKNKLALQSSALVNFETMMISRFQMFKAVYFHKTVRAGEVMLLEAMSLADDHLGLSKMNAEEYVKHTDDTILEQLTSLPETNSDLKAAKKFRLIIRIGNSSNVYLKNNLWQKVIWKKHTKTI